ncbi:MAG TPA: efflux RND transporter periplasmic adaptor subunit [Gammaproteobacteria bacterium]|nr:efflux RND transporter periplasmic adaptor subunit [Gammaproteobacteria bacterium]
MRTWVTRAAGAAAALLLGACSPTEEGEQEEQVIPAVEGVQVRTGTLPLEERLAGSVVARNQTEIFAEVSGRIVEVLANDGDRVTAGAPLVRLRATEFEEQLRQAEAGLSVAEARVKQAEANDTRARAALKRMETIVERNLGSAAELEGAQAAAASAEAELLLMRAERLQAASLVEERRSALGKTTVRAPITGVVGGRNAEVGQLATGSSPLFVIGDPNAVRVTITLTQSMLGYIETGTAANVYSGAQDPPIAAKVSRISPFLHPVTRTTNAEIDVDEQGSLLRPGMFVTVDVLYGQSEVGVLVPNNAIYHDPRDGREGIWLASVEEALRPLEPGSGADVPRSELDPSGPVTVAFVPVRVVARGRLVTAVEGLAADDWVVTVGHELLANNDSGKAIVQPTPWEHILRLQQMQTRDLFDVIRRKQELAGGALN